MRAVQVTKLGGPDAVEIRDVPEPTADGPFGPQLLVDVHAVGISFPDLLLSKGEYQLKPDLPSTLGVDFAGVVRSAPDGSGFSAGDRVAACLPHGGAAETVGLGPDSVFALPDNLSFEQGAAIPMNYLTAQFALKERGQVRKDETVLVHGAAGGVGTASLQVARGYGARTIAVVSTEEKADFVRDLGADEVLLVVGFTAGSIPQVKVNRLLLNNIDVRGVGWGAYAMVRPGFMRKQWEALLPMIESGVVDPPVGTTYPLEQVS